MSRRRRILTFTAAALAVTALATAVWLKTRPDAEAAPAAETDALAGFDTGDAFEAGVAIPVEGDTVRRGDLVLAVTASGQATARRQTAVYAEVGGRVLGVAVRENGAVNAGAPLVAIDPAEYELAVEEAEARVRQADAEYRSLVLFDDRIEDAEVRRERDRVARARSGLDAAEVALRRAQMNLARARVRAPFAGRVASVKVVPGQVVRAGDELLTVVTLDPIDVDVQVLEGELAHLRPGASVRVAFAAFPDAPVTGTIETINPIVDRETRTATVTVSVRNPDARILPGMYARVSLDARRFEDRVLVPREAILERDRRTMLFVLEDGHAKWRYVTTGLHNDDVVEIVESPETDMVEPGEVVLTGGHFTLIHDARVRLVPDAAAEGGREQ